MSINGFIARGKPGPDCLDGTAVLLSSTFTQGEGR